MMIFDLFSQTSCESENATLAVIETAEENQFVKDFIATLTQNSKSKYAQIESSNEPPYGKTYNLHMRKQRRR